jgi:hypothetical protein
LVILLFVLATLKVDDVGDAGVDDEVELRIAGRSVGDEVLESLMMTSGVPFIRHLPR